MGDKTGIQWSDATWNPTRGCSIVSPGCKNCYAMIRAHMMDQPGGAYEGLTEGGLVGAPGERVRNLKSTPIVWNGRVREIDQMLGQPFRWKKPRMIFVDSMSDLFHEGISDDFIAEVFMVMGMTDRHTYQLLTKRPDRMHDLLNDQNFWLRIGAKCEAYAEHVEKQSDGAMMGFDAWWQGIQEQQCFPNVQLGVSVEDQPRADERIPHLLETPAAVRFISAEPLLGPVGLSPLRVRDDKYGLDRAASIYALSGSYQIPDCHFAEDHPSLDWVIVGGESGHRARPCKAAWIRKLVRQCADAKVPCFVKQLGSNWSFDEKTEYADWLLCRIEHSKGGDMAEWPVDLQVQQYPEKRSS